MVKQSTSVQCSAMNENVDDSNSPTAIALGSSAIGFGAELLSGSLWFFGADPSWAARRFRGRFRQGSTKVPPRFHQGSSKGAPRFHQSSPSFVVSPIFWHSLSWAAKRFCGRFHQGFTKVPPRFHRGSTKVSPRLCKSRDLSGLLRQIRFWVPKGSWKVPPSLL